MADRELNILIKITSEAATRSVTVLQKAIRGIGTAASYALGFLKTLWNQIFSFKGLIAGVGLGYLAKSFIDAASSAENYRARLIPLLGSVKEANRLFNEMSTLAAKVPATYDEIMQAATQLASAMNVDQIKKWMPVLLDLQAVSGVALEEVTRNFVSATNRGIAAAELFRNKGLDVMMGFKQGAIYSGEETARKIWEAWESSSSKFRGTTNRMATTWDGLMSNLEDAWFQFRTAVMDAGLFAVLKRGIQEILDWIEAKRKSGQLQAWAQSISDAVVNAIKNIVIYARYMAGTVLELIAGVKANLDVIGARGAVALERLSSPKGWWHQFSDLVRGGAGIESRVEMLKTYMAQWEARESKIEGLLPKETTDKEVESMTRRSRAARDRWLMTLGYTQAEVEAARVETIATNKTDDASAALLRQAEALKNVTAFQREWAKILEDLKKPEEERAAEDDAWAKHLQNLQSNLERERVLRESFDKIKIESMKRVAEYQKQIEDAAAQRRQESLDAQWESMRISGQIASDMAGVFEELWRRSGEKQKAFLIAWKTMKIIEATISTITASMHAFEAGVKIGGPAGSAIGTAMAAAVMATGLAKVGLIATQKFARGGLVREGTTGTADDVPVLASRGEFWHPADAVNYYGLGAMEAIRQRAVPRDLLAGYGGLSPRTAHRCFAAGGLVTSPGGEAAGLAGSNVTVANFWDERQLEQYLSSRPGERVILSIMQKNAHRWKEF